MKGYVRKGLVSTKTRTKEVALWADSEEIVTFLWCCDEYVYIHPRIPIQLTWYTIVCSIWGLRPGEISESSAHRGSNEGLLYKDIRLFLCPHKQSGKLRYQLHIQLRNRKFQRNDEGKLYVASIYLHQDEAADYLLGQLSSFMKNLTPKGITHAHLGGSWPWRCRTKCLLSTTI